MEEKDLFEKINEESEKNIPNEYNKILFAAREQGLFTSKTVGVNAQSDGKTAAVYGVTKRERNIIAITLASLTAACLAIALPIGLSGSPSLPPVGDDNTGDTIAADFDLGEQYATGAVAASKLAEVYLGDSAEVSLADNGGMVLMSAKSAVYPDESGIERYISEFDNYFYACNSFFGEKPANVETVENHDAKYDNSVIISGKFSNGDTVYYAMYYSEARIIGDTTVTGTEVKYYLEGYLVLNEKHYFMYGERVYTDATKANEKSLSLTAYPVNENKNSRVEMSLEYGVGGAVKSYEFTVYKNYNKISESVVTIPEKGDTAYTVKFSGDDGERDGKFTVERPQTGWGSLKVGFEMGNLTSSFYVKTTANTVERVVTPEGFEIDDNGDGTCSITKFPRIKPLPAELFIPDTLDGKKVVKIGWGAFQTRSELERVVVPEGVTTLSTYAFSSCPNLTEVVLPTTLTAIDSIAFQSCEKLAKINLPENLITLGNYCFNMCSALENVVLPEKLETIEDDAFGSCAKIKNIHFPASVKNIGSGIFRGVALDSITVDGANENFYVESGCLIEKENKKVILSQTDFKIPDYVKIIGCEAFEYCNYLKDLVLPASVKELESYAFSYSSLESITLSGVEKIGSNTFSSSQLTNINFSENLVSIGNDAFQSCHNLVALNLPASLKDIPASAIYYCRALQIITVAAGNSKYYSEGNCLIETATSTLVFGCNGSVIPDDGSVRMIGPNAFFGQSFGDLILPSGITFIGPMAFANCYMYSVTIPDTVQTIEFGAFSHCRSLRYVYIDEHFSHLDYIGDNAFYECSSLLGMGSLFLPDMDSSSLPSLNIPRNVQFIGRVAFGECENLKEVTFYNDYTQLSTDNIFVGCKNLTSITLPMFGATELPDGLFKDCFNLESVTIGAYVKTIGEQTFYGCSNLKEITFLGTKAEWLAMERGAGWDWDTGDFVVICSDGKLAKDGTVIS